MVKKRIDLLLTERGIAETSQKAQALIMAGKVLVEEQRIDKPGMRIDETRAIRVTGVLPYVSRAGAKLAAALAHFDIPVAGRVCADLGASTGGFTDCLLQHGARLVSTFDVGAGQLAWKLRGDPRVVVRDGFNVRDLTAEELPEGVSLVTVDLSFISLTKILTPLKKALVGRLASANALEEASADVVVLVKPQFEVRKGEVGKGGIVRDRAARLKTLQAIEDFAVRVGYRSMGSIPSPVAGAKGNEEFLLYLLIHGGISSQA